MLTAEVEKLPSFLEAMNYRTADAGGRNGFHGFLTISRQAGAGAHTLAHAVLEEFAQEPEDPALAGWTLFDAAMCQKRLAEARLHVPLERLRAETLRSAMDDLGYQIFALQPPQDDILEKTFHIIQSLALKGKVIFIGRGAVAVTRCLPQGIHIRLVAPLSRRLERMAAYWQVPAVIARRRVLEEDDSRARLMRRYFGLDIDDPLLYDAVWNTDRLPTAHIAALLLRWVKQKEARRSGSSEAARSS